MLEIVSAGVIIYRIKNNIIEYLLLHHIAGHWDFAKGKIESGETIQEAALRELDEETGLRTTLEEGFEKSIEYSFIDRSGESTRKTVHYFIGRVGEETIRLSREHKRYLWLPYHEAYAKITYNTAKSVLEKSHAFIKHHDEQLI